MSAIAKPLALLALLATVAPPALYMFEGLSANAPDAAASQRNDAEDAVEATAAADDVANDVDGEVAESDSTADNGRLMPENRMKVIMLAGAILWFCTAPAWLKEND